eukprot:3776577-Rhodomonas_salina.1
MPTGWGNCPIGQKTGATLKPLASFRGILRYTTGGYPGYPGTRLAVQSRHKRKRETRLDPGTPFLCLARGSELPRLPVITRRVLYAAARK